MVDKVSLMEFEGDSYKMVVVVTYDFFRDLYVLDLDQISIALQQIFLKKKRTFFQIKNL